MDTSNDALPHVFIPSKGRADQRIATWHLLLADGVSFTVVVEPQDRDAYVARLSELQPVGAGGAPCWAVEVLPEAERGVSYVRNHIVASLAPRSGWFWIVDDDIKAFVTFRDRKRVPLAAHDMFRRVLHRMQRFPAAALFSLEYERFGYQYGDDDVRLNSYNNIAVLLNRQRIPPGVEYRGRLREDYDFTLQLIRHGCTTVRFKNLAFCAPCMSKAPGGMTPFYKSQHAAIRRENTEFVARWPSVAVEQEKGSEANGTKRFDVHVAWIRLDVTRGSDPVAVLTSSVPLAAAPKSRCVVGRRKKRRRGAYCDSEAESESTTTGGSGSGGDEASDGGGAFPEVGAKQAARRPRRPPAERRKKVEPGWFGWEMVPFRNVPLAFAEAMGFVEITSTVKLGDDVCVIPIECDMPALLVGTVVEISRVGSALRFSVCPCRRVYGRNSGLRCVVATHCFAVPEDHHFAEVELERAFELARDDGSALLVQLAPDACEAPASGVSPPAPNEVAAARDEPVPATPLSAAASLPPAL